MSTVQQSHTNNSTSAALPPPVKEVKPAEPEKKAEKKDDPTPLFWRMFGASCMSIAASLGIVLYIQITTNLAGLRADVTQLREGYIQLVPKSEFNQGYNRVTGDIQLMKVGNLAAADSWSSRMAELERKIERMRDAHKEQIDALHRENQLLRERMAVVENRTATVRPKN